MKKGLSVRETEDGVRRLLTQETRKPLKEEETPEVQALREELRRFLKTQVRIKMKGNKGRIEIDFYSLDDLERILQIIQSIE